MSFKKTVSNSNGVNSNSEIQNSPENHEVSNSNGVNSNLSLHEYGLSKLAGFQAPTE